MIKTLTMKVSFVMAADLDTPDSIVLIIRNGSGIIWWE
jgi:hypothetical protein